MACPRPWDRRRRGKLGAGAERSGTARLVFPSIDEPWAAGEPCTQPRPACGGEAAARSPIAPSTTRRNLRLPARSRSDRTDIIAAEGTPAFLRDLRDVLRVSPRKGLSSGIVSSPVTSEPNVTCVALLAPRRHVLGATRRAGSPSPLPRGSLLATSTCPSLLTRPRELWQGARLESRDAASTGRGWASSPSRAPALSAQSAWLLGTTPFIVEPSPPSQTVSLRPRPVRLLQELDETRAGKVEVLPKQRHGARTNSVMEVPSRAACSSSHPSTPSRDDEGTGHLRLPLRDIVLTSRHDRGGKLARDRGVASRATPREVSRPEPRTPRRPARRPSSGRAGA
jgi:hypothetical protein